jgi:hypothetical protein
MYLRYAVTNLTDDLLRNVRLSMSFSNHPARNGGCKISCTPEPSNEFRPGRRFFEGYVRTPDGTHQLLKVLVCNAITHTASAIMVT